MNETDRRFVLPEDKEVFPRCESKRVTVYANDYANMDKTCKHSATMKLDGKWLCKRHGQAYALEIVKRR